MRCDHKVITTDFLDVVGRVHLCTRPIFYPADITCSISLRVSHTDFLIANLLVFDRGVCFSIVLTSRTKSLHKLILQFLAIVPHVGVPGSLRTSYCFALIPLLKCLLYCSAKHLSQSSLLCSPNWLACVVLWRRSGKSCFKNNDAFIWKCV